MRQASNYTGSKFSHLYDSEILAEACRELLEYRPESGELWWKCRPRPYKTDLGKAWKKRADVKGDGLGYRCVWIPWVVDGETTGIPVKAHKIAWLLEKGEWPAGHIDHIDRDPSNNRIVNLRVVCRSRNMQNRKHTGKGFSHTVHRGKNGKEYHYWELNLAFNGKRWRKYFPYTDLGKWECMQAVAAQRWRIEQLKKELIMKDIHNG